MCAEYNCQATNTKSTKAIVIRRRDVRNVVGNRRSGGSDGLDIDIRWQFVAIYEDMKDDRYCRIAFGQISSSALAGTFFSIPIFAPDCQAFIITCLSVGPSDNGIWA